MKNEEQISSIVRQLETALKSDSNGTVHILESFSFGVIEVNVSLAKRLYSISLAKSYTAVFKEYPDFKFWKTHAVNFFIQTSMLHRSGKKSIVSEFLLTDPISTALIDNVNDSYVEWKDKKLKFGGLVKRKDITLMQSVARSYLTLVERFEKKI